jgi:hypothetical protein
MIGGWRSIAPPDSLFIAHGGTAEDFAGIAHEHKSYIDSARLRTRDHQREKQSYMPVFRAASDWLQKRNFSFVHFAEQDHLPLVADLNDRQTQFLRRTNADVLGFRARRVDHTHYPNYLYHASDPRFLPYWKTISKRHNGGVVLRMTGTGSFWTRKAFEAVASCSEPFPIYMELHLPTLAYHLGFTVCDWGAQNQFVHHLGDRSHEVESARQKGGWTLHPAKHFWSAPRLCSQLFS